MTQVAGIEQLGSVDRQTTFFMTLKVVVIGSGVDVGVDPTPSCVQVAFSPGCVHIRFSHSWFTVVSNPLAEPLFLHFSTVIVLPLPFPLPLSRAPFLLSCGPFFT